MDVIPDPWGPNEPIFYASPGPPDTTPPEQWTVLARGAHAVLQQLLTHYQDRNEVDLVRHVHYVTGRWLTALPRPARRPRLEEQPEVFWPTIATMRAALARGEGWNGIAAEVGMKPRRCQAWWKRGLKLAAPFDF
jgi:hypothetical protein